MATVQEQAADQCWRSWCWNIVLPNRTDHIVNRLEFRFYSANLCKPCGWKLTAQVRYGPLIQEAHKAFPATVEFVIPFQNERALTELDWTMFVNYSLVSSQQFWWSLSVIPREFSRWVGVVLCTNRILHGTNGTSYLYRIFVFSCFPINYYISHFWAKPFVSLTFGSPNPGASPRVLLEELIVRYIQPLRAEGTAPRDMPCSSSIPFRFDPSIRFQSVNATHSDTIWMLQDSSTWGFFSQQFPSASHVTIIHKGAFAWKVLCSLLGDSDRNHLNSE